MAIVYRDGEPGKVCTKCKEWKPLARMPPRKVSLDGYNSICRDCENVKNRAWRANNRERVAELNREFYEANHEKRLAYHKQYRQENKGYFKEKMKEFHEKNPTYHRDTMRKWGRANPDKVQERDNRRHAAKKKSGGRFTAAEWRNLKHRYNYTCLRCGRREPEIKLTVDHVVPLIKGGSNTIENIQPLCKPCNSAKHAQTTDYRESWHDT